MLPSNRERECYPFTQAATTLRIIFSPFSSGLYIHTYNEECIYFFPVSLFLSYGLTDLSFAQY